MGRGKGFYSQICRTSSFSFLLGLAFVFKILDKTFNMRGILYTIAVLCIIGWLIGVFVYSVTGLIHILIVLAIISLILAINKKR